MFIVLAAAAAAAGDPILLTIVQGGCFVKGE